jgi:hypothetical protein
METQKSYYLSGVLRIAVIAFSILMATTSIVLIAIMTSLLFHASYPFNLLLQIMIAVVALLGGTTIIVIINTIMTRLTLSEAGLEYRTYWYSVNVDWENIKEVDSLRSGLNVMEVFVLSVPVKATISLPFLLFLRKKVSIIPVSIFGVHARDIRKV